jgi:hypothetical protein
MGDIYRNASMVMVWLGKGNEGIWAAISRLEDIGRGRHEHPLRDGDPGSISEGIRENIERYESGKLSLDQNTVYFNFYLIVYCFIAYFRG